MTVKTFDVKQDAGSIVSVSEAAAEHFAKQVKRSHSVGIRLSLKQAGCTGYKYVIDEIDEKPKNDVCLALSTGVSLYIDTKYVGAIRGTEIDVRQQGLNFNLIMENPNVKDECGCGESFSIENFEQEN